MRRFAAKGAAMRCMLTMLSISWLATTAIAAPPAGTTGYAPKVSVTEATRLDAIFPAANQSPATPPEGWLNDYDSTKTTFELFVPRAYNPKKRWPLVVFISPGQSAMGWAHWKATCEKMGILFAGPHDAGNDVSITRRVRIVMDVLDEVKRRYQIDPDRTYLGGFSGGGRIACAIAFALPEHFGGVIPVCAAGDLRQESWLRQRVIDRLSVAHITGETDFNRGEVERFRSPQLSEVGVRSRVWVIPKMGHSVPTGGPLTEAIEWLDAEAPTRAKQAERFPASRMENDAILSRSEQAQLLFKEAKQRLEEPKTLYSGLMQLSGIRVRWSDLPVANEATTILRDYDARPDRPWEAEDLNEQRRFLIAKARALDAYAVGSLPDQYRKQRPDMLKGAMTLWLRVVQDGQDEAAVAEGQKRLIELGDLLEKEKPSPK